MNTDLSDLTPDWQQYVRDLREEAKTWRLKFRQAAFERDMAVRAYKTLTDELDVLRGEEHDRQ